MARKEFTGKDKVVTKMTRDGLTEEKLRDGCIKRDCEAESGCIFRHRYFCALISDFAVNSAM